MKIQSVRILRTSEVLYQKLYPGNFSPVNKDRERQVLFTTINVLELNSVAGQSAGRNAVRWDDSGRLKESRRDISWVPTVSFVCIWIANTSNYNVKSYYDIAIKKSWVDDQLKFSKMLVITLNCMMTKRVLHLNNVGYVDEITKRHSWRWNTRNGDGEIAPNLNFFVANFPSFTLPKNFLHFVLVFPIGERRVLLTYNGGGKFLIIFQWRVNWITWMSWTVVPRTDLPLKLSILALNWIFSPGT